MWYEFSRKEIEEASKWNKLQMGVKWWVVVLQYNKIEEAKREISLNEPQINRH